MRFLLVTIFILFSGFSVSAKTVFVSTSKGCDANTGLNKASPLKSISKAISISDTILLKSGDIFYESFAVDNKYVGSYGKGNKPTVCGYKRLLKPEWQYVGDNVWVISLVRHNFSGFVVNGSSFLNNIGCIHDYKKNEIHGRKVQNRKDLDQNWDFWQTQEFANRKVMPEMFDSLYLYLSENPNKLSLEFTIGANGISANNSVIDNLNIIGFGGHGIAAGTKTTIRNCRIDAIGGRIQIGYKAFTSLGNGIEFYVSADKENCLVSGCYITRCYDCGITIQGSGKGQATPRNILIEDNLVTNCCQGWEDFLRNDENVVFHNCVVRRNLFINNGNTSGFSYPSGRFKYCHVLGNNFKGDKGLILEENTFIGGNYYCTSPFNKKYMSHIWRDNICYIKRGDFLLSNYSGTADVIRVPKEIGNFKSIEEATDAAIALYRAKTGDQTSSFRICANNRIKTMSRKLKKEWLKKHKYKEYLLTF